MGLFSRPVMVCTSKKAWKNGVRESFCCGRVLGPIGSHHFITRLKFPYLPASGQSSTEEGRLQWRPVHPSITSWSIPTNASSGKCSLPCGWDTIGSFHLPLALKCDGQGCRAMIGRATSTTGNSPAALAFMSHRGTTSRPVHGQHRALSLLAAMPQR